MDNIEAIKLLLAEINNAVKDLEEASKIREPSRYAVIGSAGFIKGRSDYISALCEAEITINQIRTKIGA